MAKEHTERLRGNYVFNTVDDLISLYKSKLLDKNTITSKVENRYKEGRKVSVSINDDTYTYESQEFSEGRQEETFREGKNEIWKLNGQLHRLGYKPAVDIQSNKAWIISGETYTTGELYAVKGVEIYIDEKTLKTIKALGEWSTFKELKGHVDESFVMGEDPEKAMKNIMPKLAEQNIIKESIYIYQEHLDGWGGSYVKDDSVGKLNILADAHKIDTRKELDGTYTLTKDLEKLGNGNLKDMMKILESHVKKSDKIYTIRQAKIIEIPKDKRLSNEIPFDSKKEAITYQVSKGNTHNFSEHDKKTLSENFKEITTQAYKNYPDDIKQLKIKELNNDIKKNPLIEKIKSFCKERDAKQKAPEKTPDIER